LQNFGLFREKDKKLKNTESAIKIRVLTNQPIRIKSEYQDLTRKSQKATTEFNFFGLLLRVSKDYLTPSYNLVIHIHGGGVMSQSSESHLSYLTKYVNR
jgi:hypothetical protein